MTKIEKFLSAISVLPGKTDCRTRSGFAMVNYQIYHARAETEKEQRDQGMARERLPASRTRTRIWDQQAAGELYSEKRGIDNENEKIM